MFDGLLIPLLALTGLIGWFWHWVFYDLIRAPLIAGQPQLADPDMRGWRETSGTDLVLRRTPDGSEYQLRAYMRIHPIPSQSWEKEFEKDIDRKFSASSESNHWPTITPDFSRSNAMRTRH